MSDGRDIISPLESTHSNPSPYPSLALTSSLNLLDPGPRFRSPFSNRPETVFLRRRMRETTMAVISATRRLTTKTTMREATWTATWAR